MGIIDIPLPHIEKGSPKVSYEQIDREQMLCVD